MWSAPPDAADAPELPDDCVALILCALDARNGLVCATVCKRWNDMCKSPAIWERLFLVEWIMDWGGYFVNISYILGRPVVGRLLRSDRESVSVVLELAWRGRLRLRLPLAASQGEPRAHDALTVHVTLDTSS